MKQIFFVAIIIQTLRWFTGDIDLVVIIEGGDVIDVIIADAGENGKKNNNNNNLQNKLHI